MHKARNSKLQTSKRDFNLKPVESKHSRTFQRSILRSFQAKQALLVLKASFVFVFDLFSSFEFAEQLPKLQASRFVGRSKKRVSQSALLRATPRCVTAKQQSKHKTKTRDSQVDARRTATSQAKAKATVAWLATRTASRSCREAFFLCFLLLLLQRKFRVVCIKSRVAQLQPAAR